MSETNYYVLLVVGDVEPHVHGPYANARNQLAAARELRREDGSQESGIFAATVKDGKLCVEAYCGGALDVAEDATEVSA